MSSFETFYNLLLLFHFAVKSAQSALNTYLVRQLKLLQRTVFSKVQGEIRKFKGLKLCEWAFFNQLLQILTSSCVSSANGKNVASKIATWSVLSFCHKLISIITRWVALFNFANAWNMLAWFSSAASARAITCKNYKHLLNIILPSVNTQHWNYLWHTLVFL